MIRSAWNSASRRCSNTDGEFLKEQIAIERGTSPTDWTPLPADQSEVDALRLLAGDDPRAALSGDSGSAGRYQALRRIRAAIEVAVERGRDRAVQEFFRRAVAAAELQDSAWRANLPSTAMAIVRLQRLNRERLELAAAIRGRSSNLPPLVCEIAANPKHLLGTGVTAFTDRNYYYVPEVNKFIQTCIDQGITTPREIERALED